MAEQPTVPQYAGSGTPLTWPLTQREAARRARLVRWLVGAIVAAVLFTCAGGWDWLAGNRSIRFYGRVTDDKGVGLGGATVTYKVKWGSWLFIPYLPFADNSETRQYRVTTGGDGTFAIRTRGSSITIMRVAHHGINVEGVASFVYDNPSRPLPTDPRR
ncbi:MAG TPA: hypothetical protein VK324_02165, partial [Tepidisphaeraceae bacterium]|nr:hypothetical protein [Tepidisphaeraceae bacterium]